MPGWEWLINERPRPAAGVICGMGDVIAQQVIERRGRGHKWKRTAKLTLIGFLFTVRENVCQWSSLFQE